MGEAYSERIGGGLKVNTPEYNRRTEGVVEFCLSLHFRLVPLVQFYGLT